eukprot:GILI01000820.1.p1 GENE.GILI01000820.1~~GILI01000820.1.p1  ORF type:complete len:534 (+),score=176.17 GILI01000820.1:195-1604(+)
MDFPPQDAASAAALDKTIAEKLARIPEFVMGVMSADPSAQYDATQEFRKLLSIEKNPPIRRVIDCNVVPRFIEFLQNHQFPSLQFEAAWALTNIASGSSEDTRVVVDMGAVPIFVQLLSSPSEEVKEQAVWALGNISGDSAECRNMVLSAGALAPLLKELTETQKLSMQRNATWTLSNLCRGKPPPNFQDVKPALPVLANLIYLSDIEVLTDACWALSYLSDGPNERIGEIIFSGVCSRLVDLLDHKSYYVQTPALRTVGNIVTGDDAQTQVIINAQALQKLGALLQSSKRGIRKEACWTISNITAGHANQIQAVINAGLIPHMVELLANAEYEIRKEAVWAISNATSARQPHQIEHLVQCGCIPHLCALLIAPDPKIVTVVLEGLENILEAGALRKKDSGENPYAMLIEGCGGLEKLESLQQHQNEDIYKKVVDIFEKYFELEDNDEGADMQGNYFNGGNFTPGQIQF